MKNHRLLLPVGRLTIELHPDGDRPSDALSDWNFEVENSALTERVTAEHVPTADGLLSFSIVVDATDLPPEAVSTGPDPRWLLLPTTTPEPTTPPAQPQRSGLTEYAVHVRETRAFWDIVYVDAASEEEAKELALEEWQADWPDSEELSTEATIIPMEEV